MHKQSPVTQQRIKAQPGLGENGSIPQQLRILGVVEGQRFVGERNHRLDQLPPEKRNHIAGLFEQQIHITVDQGLIAFGGTVIGLILEVDAQFPFHERHVDPLHGPPRSHIGHPQRFIGVARIVQQ